MLKNMVKTATLVALSLLVMAGCGQDKQLADTAIKNAETALSDMAADAQAFMPEEYASAQDALTAAKQNFMQGHYKEALAAAQELAARAPEMATMLETKKQEMTRAWTDMTASMPAMMTAIQGEVDKLAKAKKLPAGMDAAQLEGVKAQVASLNQTWTEASNAFNAGNMAEAVAKGKMVKDGATGVMQTLGMKPMM